MHIAEKIPVCIGLSLACWIIGFWTLRIVPIPFHIWIYCVIIGSLVLANFFRSKKKRVAKRKPFLHMFAANMSALVLFAVLAIPGIQLANREIAPTGRDMSMHAYLSSVIYRADGFPKTLKPLAPVDSFGFYPVGFSALTATLMRLDQLPVHVNSVWMTALTYWLFSVSLYVLLRQRFSIYISAAVVILISWANPIPNSIIEWGANPTVLSLDFLTLAIASALAIKHPLRLLFTAVFCIASALTHYMLPVAALYVLIPLSPFLYRHLSGLVRTKHIVGTAIICFVAVAPVLWHLKSAPLHISEATRLYVASLQQADLIVWQGAPGWAVLVASFRYIQSMISQPVLQFYACCVILIALSRPRRAILHVIVIISMLLLLFNSRYWILPFSSLLYPDRIILLLLIPIGLGIAEGLTVFVEYAYAYFVRQTKTNYVILHLLVFSLLTYAYVPTLQISYRKYLASAELQIVSKNDIAAFQWLSSHTNGADVVMNNYYDGGIWIPAIAGRAITAYHTNPLDMDALRRYRPQPAYAYVGDVSLMRLGNDTVTTAILNNPDKYELVYQRGNAKIYRVLEFRDK
jgi:hypothetical protein